MSGQNSAEAVLGLERFEPIANGLDHPECVVWDSRRNVLYAGGEAGQIYAIDGPDDVREIADSGEFVLGLALDEAGRIYACAGSKVVRVTPDDGQVEVLSDGAPDRPMQKPNYLAFGLDGTLYVTDSGDWGDPTGVVYRVGTDRSTEVWTTALPSFPNGCCLAPDGRSLLVVQSRDPGVWRVPISADGSAGEPQRFCALSGTVPDGVAFDSDGRLYVSCYRPDRIYRVPAGGAPELLVDDPSGIGLCAPTNIAFHGSRLQRLAVANLGSLHVSSAELDATGHPIPRPELNS